MFNSTKTAKSLKEKSGKALGVFNQAIDNIEASTTKVWESVEKHREKIDKLKEKNRENEQLIKNSEEEIKELYILADSNASTIKNLQSFL